MSGGVFVFLLAFTALAQEAPNLKIAVKDPAGNPVPNARVSLRPAFGGTPFEVTTGSDGKAQWTPRVEGRLLLVTRADGFADESRYVDLHGEAVRVEIPLEVAMLREQVVVSSGSRIEELQQDSPVKVEAVTREQMQSTGYERLTDVLAEIPGVVTRSGSSASVGTEQIRGISARQVAVLQDGLPMIGARGIKSGNLNLNRQSTGRLDRVEVVKGASSALFGSDAIGGVINMISREPTKKVQGNLNFSGGSLGIFDGRGDIGTRYKNLTAFLDLERHQQDAYRLIPNSTTTVGPNIRRNDALFRTRYQFTPRFALGFTANAYHNNETSRSSSETGLVNSLYNDSVQNYALVGDFAATSTTNIQLRAYSVLAMTKTVHSVPSRPLPLRLRYPTSMNATSASMAPSPSNGDRATSFKADMNGSRTTTKARIAWSAITPDARSRPTTSGCKTESASPAGRRSISEDASPATHSSEHGLFRRPAWWCA